MEKDPLLTKVDAEVQAWLQPPYDFETQRAVRDLKEKDPAALIDAFYTTLPFGTGGMRGLMGVGTNRMNRYTVRRATQGLANYILAQKVKGPKVFISYDSRHHSLLFAQETASVLAGNGIGVILTKELRPTPFVSFNCRHFACIAAVMITASHNPPTYNGYKVYWKGGGQVVPPHDIGILHAVRQIETPLQVAIASLNHPLIHFLGSQGDEPYFQAITSLQNYPDVNQRDGNQLKIIYSPLHGCGITTLPEALKRWGFTHLSLVEKQKTPDGNFPTAPSPNPEQKEALELGIRQLIREKGDLFLASDPDGDRLGVAILHRGNPIIFSGNQIASLCLFYLCNNTRFPKNSAVITTIVTSDLFKTIAKSYGIPCFEVLTGFKYIGEKMEEWEKSKEFSFLFGAEESLGFLYGTFCRDKDASIAACLIAEMTLHLKRQNKNLYDSLLEIYEKYGPFQEAQLSLSFEESEGSMQAMEQAMNHLRNRPPAQIGGDRVTKVEDYLKRGSHPSFPRSNMLLFRLEDDSKFIIRPSGTEPKIKIYGLARHFEKNRLSSSLDELRKALILNP